MGSIASARPGELLFTFFCDMGVPCSSSNNSKSIRYKDNACSFEKVNKNSLMLYQIIEHKLVSIKFKTNYIRCKYHLKGGSMKKCNIHYIGATIFVFKCHYLWPSNSLF